MSRKLKLFFEIAMLFAAASVLLSVAEQLKPASRKVVPVTTALVEPAEASSPSELTIFKPEKSWPSFTLLPESGSAQVHLLNHRAEKVHTWNTDADRARLLPNGNLLVVHGSKWGIDNEPWASMRSEVREYDWQGNIVWSYTAPDVAHHDIQRLENGNTLVLYREMMPTDVKRKIYLSGWRASPVRTDSIQEVTPEGEVVWDWKSYQSLDINSCGRRGCDRYAKDLQPNKRRKDWTHINTIAPIPENHFFDSGDLRFRPGNLLIVPRQWWQVLLIDRATGNPVWEYGGDYKGGIVRGHEAHMIEPGLPGAGNILIFDNGVDVERDHSIVLEVNPQTNELVWFYEDGKSFFSRAAGSVQRLPNGNTFISEDVEGRAFEVTPEKEIVWEYKGKLRLSRSQRYAPDHCPQLAELELS